MELLDRLEASANAEESYFRAQLLKEDIGRLRRLEELSRSVPNLTSFKKEGAVVGWTPGDTRSWELKSTLEPFLEAFYASAKEASTDRNGQLLSAWQAFDAHRVALLVGCLSRVPSPEFE